jgi:hypothetical protein
MIEMASFNPTYSESPKERPLLAATSSGEVRFQALSVRSPGRSQRTAKGRFDPFAKPWADDRYLRIPLKKSWVWRGFGWITGPEVGDVFVFAGGL